MSLFVNTFLKNSFQSNLRFIRPCRSFHFTHVNCLYSPASLGIDGYLLTRKRSKEQFANFAEKFRIKMNDFASDSKNMIFTEDLKNMVHLAEPTDLELVLIMIKKFNTQQSEYRFGSFVFGPVVMRMFHFLDAPKEALENTPKSLEYASKLWTQMNQVGTLPVRRACTYFAALALNQGAPQRAMESISTQRQHYVTIRNIKAMALADMGRVDDALPVLRSVLDIDRPSQTDKHTFFEETVERVRQAVEKSDSSDIKKEFDDIYKALKDRGLIENKTLEQLLNAEILMTKKTDSTRAKSPFQMKKMPFIPRHKYPKRIV
ncbi:unnamed protein product [Arctia plantaginis]|uniref:Uncharacterized protein n=1 Tax=Arctia plantaginis TaxID=874455 RepID=A0A8S0ZJW6_ARCPL|nr:unnamed protein product [Arctia plantaginis]